MSFDPNKPFNELPKLPPDQSHIEKISIYKKLSSAKASLAELKGRAPIIPNQKMLLIIPNLAIALSVQEKIFFMMVQLQQQIG